MAVTSFEMSTTVVGSLRADTALERLLSREPVNDASNVAACVDRIDQIMSGLAADPVVGPRLSLARCALEVHVVGVVEPCCFSLVLDGQPATFQHGPCAEAAVKLYMTPDVLASFCAGRLHVAIAITDGRIGYEGPVRNVLRVLPLIRRYAEEHPW
jgi:hypothetical protein